LTDLLKEYLLIKKDLPLIGVGVLQLRRVPSSFDIGNRQFLPPQITYELVPEVAVPTIELSNWLSARMGLDAAEALSRYKHFCEELLQLIDNGKKPLWKGWGQWGRDQQGVIQFRADTSGVQLSPVSATKIIRDNAEHMVRVGEDNRTSAEMNQLLQQKKVFYPIEKIATWSWLVLAALWLGWHVYSRSLTTDSFASPAKIKTTVTPTNNYQEF
jgi:hypothetical protein